MGVNQGSYFVEPVWLNPWRGTEFFVEQSTVHTQRCPDTPLPVVLGWPSTQMRTCGRHPHSLPSVKTVAVWCVNLVHDTFNQPYGFPDGTWGFYQKIHLGLLEGCKLYLQLAIQLTQVRMAIIKRSTDKVWRQWAEKGTLPHCWWECKLVQPLWKAVWRFLRKLKGVTTWSSNPTHWHLSGENLNLKRYRELYVHRITICH